ncbi:MAG: substrate-binding domain-containing protein [Candidatus Brocadiia bacterium]
MRVKYTGVAQNLLERIENGDYEPGDILPSETDLAEEYDVNRRTLRKALDMLEKKDRIVRRRGRGTFVKASTGTSTTPLLYIGETQSHFYKDLYAAISRHAQLAGRPAVGFSPQHDPDELSDSAHLKNLLTDAGGVICDTSCWGEVCEIMPGDTPAVRISGFHAEKTDGKTERSTYIVTSNVREAVHQATHHLLNAGHHRIALACIGWGDGPDPLLQRPHPKQHSYQGYRLALQDVGIEDEFVLGFPAGQERDWQELGKRAVRRFVQQADPLPTAYICEGDFRAAPLMRILREEGLRAPEDFSVIGTGNTPWCEMLEPPLSSMSLGEEEMARMAVLLCEQTAPETTTVVRVAPRLIERSSVSVRKDERR